ncbi:hypothetical protein ABK040_003604 [Willaertia magna]
MISTFIYYFKQIIDQVFYKYFTYQLTLRDSDEEYNWFNTFFTYHPYTKQGATRLKPYKNSSTGNDFYTGTNRLEKKQNQAVFDYSLEVISKEFNKAKFVPSYGTHLIYIKGQPFIIILNKNNQRHTENDGRQREKEEVYLLKSKYQFIDWIIKYFIPPNENNNCPSPDLLFSKKKDKPWLNVNKSEVVLKNKTSAHEIFRDLLKDCYYLYMLSTREKTLIYTAYYQHWAIASVKERKRDYINEFITGRNWYGDRGIPYRRGYLLYGPPGTGKTSCISAIAATFNLNICVINLASKGLTDDTLSMLFNDAPTDAMIVLEDIDSAFKSSDDKKVNENDMVNVIETNSQQVTFSGILNCIDGISSQNLE